MELASRQNQSLDIPINSEEISEATSPKNPEKRRKPKPIKESLSPNQRKAKRRRRAVTDGDDFNVNFSKIKISESSRVLRSKVKRSYPPTFENVCGNPSCSQSDAVSKDHSYSKASKRFTKPKDQTINTPTVHVKLFIGLTSNDDRYKESATDADQLDTAQHYYRRSSRIEIIDFDDLELSNDCHGDHGTKSDHNSNDPSMENRNLNNQTNQSCKDVSVPKEDHCIQVIVENGNYRGSDVSKERIAEKPNDRKDQCKSIDDCDQNFNPKTDYEKLLAKYGEGDLYLSKGTPFFEHTHWMSDSDIASGNAMDAPRVINEDTLEPPVYLDLDQNQIAVSSSQKLPTVTHSGGVGIPTNAGSMHFPSGGCFQKLGTVVTSTVTRPEFQYCDGTASCCLSNGVCLTQSNIHDTRWYPEPLTSSSNAFPNFQTVFAHKIESLIRSKPHGYNPNGKSDITSPVITNSFSTSGGSIERIVSPVIPKQPSIVKKFPGISVPFQERNISVQPLAPESTQFDNQNGQQPECRIHLVETPPSFTRTSQPEVSSQFIPRPQATSEQTSLKSQQIRPELDCFHDSQLKTSNKPKRTRRTRAQMEIYRQEMAKTYNHRSKRNQRFPSRTSRHIVGRNFSMEYRRVHNHPQEFLYAGPSTRVSHYRYMRPQAVQQHRYSETYSVNETNLFRVSPNSGDWPQLAENFPNFSHGLAEFRSFEPLWPGGVKNSYGPLEAGLRINSSEPYQKYEEPSVESLQNPSSVMWDQEVRSIQLQSAYGNVEQVPAANSGRPYTPWLQPMATSLDQLPDNFVDLTTNEPIGQMQYY